MESEVAGRLSVAGDDLVQSLDQKIVKVRPSQFQKCSQLCDRLCGLVVRVLGYRSGGPGSIPETSRKKVVGLERGPLSLVSTTEELLDRNVAAPV
jgi:hypothetical protein